jgi:hypothetical protein
MNVNRRQVMNENQVYKNIESVKIKDNNNRDRNIAGALVNYASNKLSPLNLGCTVKQYQKFLDILYQAEYIMNERLGEDDD